MMKSKIDCCRIQWLNREFLPEDYAYKWNKNESRFSQIFESLHFDTNSTEENRNSYGSNNGGGSAPNSSNISLAPSPPRKESNFLSLFGNNNSFENCKMMDAYSLKYKSNDIDLMKILTQEDQRTTLMIKNVPNKFTKEHFLSIFNKKFEGKFNLFLLPTDVKEKKNYGYAFINFISSFYILNFYNTFHGKRWENTNSVKVCEIVYSKIQGVPRMIKHYPVKVMFLKDYHEESKEETELNYPQFSAIAQNVPKPEIPVIFTNLFVKIYPNIPIEFEATRKDFFTFDLKNMFVFEPKIEY